MEVRDNGVGIKPSDTPFMARRHFTSKISQHADLESLATYGFRGEALGSLCAVSSVTMVTKTSEEEFGRQYVLDHEGGIVSEKPSHLGDGTTVIVMHLFENVPVRKQYYNNRKRQRDEMKKVEDLIMSFGAIRPDVRFSLRHNKNAIWQKSKAANRRAALINTWGSGVMSQMQHVQRLDTDSEVRIEGFIPSVAADSQSVTRAVPDRCWVAVNDRPVTFKDVEKMVKQSYCCAVGREPSSIRHLVMCLGISLPQHQVDVNLEPNKTKVMLQNKDAVLSVLSAVLEDVYGKPPHCQPTSTAHQWPTFGQEDNIITDTNVDCPNNRGSHTPVDTQTAASDDSSYGNNAETTKERSRAIVSPDPESSSKSYDVDRIPVYKSAARLEESETADLPSRPTDLPQSASFCMDDAVVPKNFKLNFSIFEDECDLESIDESKLFGALDEASAKDPQNASGNITKEVTDVITSNIVEKDKQVNSTLSLTDWSKGRGLTNKDGRPIEPATLLIPQGATTGLTKQCTPAQLVTNQSSADSVSNSLDCSPSTADLLIRATDSVRGPDRKSATSLANQQADCSPTANQKASPVKRRLSLEEKTGKGIMFDLIGQSPIRRPQTAFALFSKEKRPQVVEQSPRCSFFNVTKTVEEKWKHLGDEGKERYEDMARKDADRYRTQLKSAQNKLSGKQDLSKGTPCKKKKKKPSLPANQGLIDRMLLSQQQRKLANQQAEEETPDVTTVDVPFSLTGLERHLKHLEVSNRDTDGKLHLIGQLESHGVWLGRRGDKVVVFNQYRAEESLLYHRLLSHHVLPCQPVEIPIILSPAIVGGDGNWKALLGMSRQTKPPDQALYYTDKRLTASGFELKQTIDKETEEIKVQVIAMATTINYYGIGDLQEILKRVATKLGVALSACRPLKVTNYLKGEAVRMVRGLPLVMPREDVEGVIHRMQELPKNCHSCLHYRPFEHPLHQIHASNS